MERGEALIVAPASRRGTAESLKEYLEKLGFRVRLELRDDRQSWEWDIWVGPMHFTDPSNCAGYFAVRRLRGEL